MITSDEAYGIRPGDIMIGPIGGLIPGVFPVAAGQALLALTRRRWTEVMTWRSWRRFRHAGVVGSLPGPDGRDRLTVIQAMPSGAEEVWLTSKHLTPGHLYIRPDYDGNWQARAVVTYARGYVGATYNFLTYAKLAAGALRHRAVEGWLRKAIGSRRDMMCSQLADQALSDAGYQLFDDGRLPQDVVPSELFLALIGRSGQHLVPGGVHAWRENADHPLQHVYAEADTRR